MCCALMAVTAVKMRLVALMNPGKHILLNAVTVPYRWSETVQTS